MRLPALALIAFLALAIGGLRAAELPAPLAGAKRILFLGDSITYGGTYVDYVEAVLRLRHPAWRGEILDLALPSETVSGLSEPGHAGGRFPRPVLRERLERVLTQTKPDLVVACYGMNDGIYHPFAPERFAAFQAGIGELRERVAAHQARLVLVTPPVFDAEPIREKTLPAGLDAYLRPFAGYDEVLARYAEWLLAQRAAGWAVIDVHGPMRAALTLRRSAAPGFTFAKDGVHPDAAGHAVIARGILTAWGLRPDDDERLATVAARPEPPLVALIRTRRKLLSDAWLGATGHQRPGMAKGLPLAEAEAQAAGLEKELRTLLTAK